MRVLSASRFAPASLFNTNGQSYGVIPVEFDSVSLSKDVALKGSSRTVVNMLFHELLSDMLIPENLTALLVNCRCCYWICRMFQAFCSACLWVH